MRYNSIILLFAILFNACCVFATNRVSTGTGSWATAGTWSPAGVPVAGDNITILTGHTITMSSSSGVCNNLSINGTATWASNGYTTNVNGNLIINNGGTLTGSRTGVLNVTGTFSVPSGASATIGRVTMTVLQASNIDGTLSLSSTTGTKTFADVNVSSTGSWSATGAVAVIINGNVTTSGTFNCNSGTYTVSGNFSVNAGTTNFEGSIGGVLTVSSGATLNANTGNCSVAGLTTIAGTINITTTTGTKSFADITVNTGGIWNSTVAENVTVTGNVTTSGTWECLSGTYTVSGDFTASAGNTNFEGSIGGNLIISSGATFDGTTGVLTVSGSTSISGTLIISTVISTKTFSDVTINSGGVWNCIVAESLTISGNLTNNGTFNSNTGTYTFSGSGKFFGGSSGITFLGAVIITGTYTNNNTTNVIIAGNLSGAGGFTQGANSELQLGGNAALTTFDASANPNNVIYNGAGAQSLVGGIYYNLEINKASNTATASAAFTCSNNLILTSGTLASGNFTHTVSGATTISGGTLSTSSTSGVYNLQSVSMTSGSIAGSATGTVTIATTLNVPSGSPTIGRCVLTVSGATIIDGSLTFNSVTGTKTLGDVTVDVGGTWSATAVVPFTINGNLSNNGTFTSNTGVYTLAGSSKTISGILSINSVAVTGSYTNNASLTIITALSGAGTFSQGAAATLNISATVANFSVMTFNASASGNTVNYNLAGAQSVRIPADGAYSNLTIAGTGTKTLVGATTISGNLNISSTLDVSATNYAINLGGNWLNTGTFTPRSGTVTLNGSGAQTITKSGGETFDILTISGSGTKTLGSAITTNGNLTINSTLDVSSSNYGITVKGNWLNNGTFTEQSGTVTFGGAAAQTIGGSTTTNFYNITQSNAAGVSLTHTQNLIGVLTISSGTFTTTGQNFTLISNASGTASIAPILGGFAGNIIMQRYTGTGPTDWRFLSSAVSGATIAQWTSYFATSGFTGATCSPSNCATCGSTCNWPSIYTYDETVAGVESNGYVAATNVTNSISNGKGFWVYLGPNPVTYAVTGPPNTFTVSPTITFTSSAGAADDGWNMIANPYPSAIDWTNAGWTKTNLNNAIYIYNSSTGSFASYVAGVSVNGGSPYIASQQSFWIQTNAASPVIKMTEAVKTTTVNPTYLKEMYSPNTSHYPMAFKDFPIPLNTNITQNSLKLTANGNGYDDETFIQFMQGATTDFDGSYDAWKMNALNPSSPNISSVINDTTDLSINSYGPLTSDISIPIRFIVSQGYSGTYSIRRDSLLMLPMSSCLFLEDLANGNMIDLRANISYSFTISDTTKAPRFLLHIYAPISKTGVNTHCSNDSTGMAIATGTGTGPWNYIWKNSSGDTLRVKNSSINPDTLSHLPVGIYSVFVSGGVCGIITDTIQIKSASTFSLASNFSNVSCNGLNDGSALALPSGGNTPYTYLWSNNSTTQQISELSTGNYSVNVTDAFGCSQTQTISITQPAPLASGFTTSSDTVNLSVNNSETFTNTSSGALTFMWDFGDTTSMDTSQNPTHYYSYSGTYTVTLIASNTNCSDTSLKKIFVVDSLNTTGISQIINSSSINVVYDNGEVYLTFDLPEATDVTISVYNLLGERICKQQANHVQHEKIKLELQTVSAGIYIAVSETKNAVLSKKIFIPSR